MVLPAGIRVGASTPVTADMTADSKVRPASSWDDEAPDSEPVPPWTAQQVQTLLAREKPFSPWRVVGLQAVVGGLLALAWWLLGSAPAQQVRSTVWGAAAVVLPHALMAWGLRRRAVQAQAALLSFLVWELIKVGLAVVILVAAAWLVRDLSWPALLVALIACLKVHLGAWWWLSRAVQETN
ncbi:ATP synthase subunit I [Roseateles puraquae]|nr:ATP synthase subunit I [Roseateles puraquae]MDG0855641.1 ATP synthase subunit I [Roseateles puraquae]